LEEGFGFNAQRTGKGKPLLESRGSFAALNRAQDAGRNSSRRSQFVCFQPAPSPFK
jgi:hypothetical protein